VLLTSLALSLGCGGEKSGNGDRGPVSMCDPARDDDGDCMKNGFEGCGLSPEPDTDGDATPDWADLDSDDDGLPDRVDAVTCAALTDSDGDGKPNHLDSDSDNDGLIDGFEDRNGDGKVGNCEKACAGPLDCNGVELEACSIPAAGAPGVCISPNCASGETDPTKTDTDGDGTFDGKEGNFICNPQSAENPFGLKSIRYVDSKNTVYARANWRLALELGALDGVPEIASPDPLESAYIFDMTAPAVELAGFMTSRKSAEDATAVTEMFAAVTAMQTLPNFNSVVLRVSGSNGTSLDGFDTVLKTILEVHAIEDTEVTEVRAALLPALTGRPPEDVTLLPPPWAGQKSRRFIVTMQTIYRATTKQTLYTGSVARADAYEDRNRATGFHADDMSNGTGLSQSDNEELRECEQFLARDTAAADIIWVLDESGSTSDDRERIAANAETFFQKSVDAGLDFRMGVTSMDKSGLFATRVEGGTGDRWIEPDEPDVFRTSINDPSGPDFGSDEAGLTSASEIIKKHLPRDNGDSQKIRENVKLVVIYVTDEHAQEVEDAGILGDFNDTIPTPDQQTQINELVAPFIEELNNENAIAHVIGEPLPHTSAPPCSGSERTYGYYEVISALGGQLGSICQLDLGPTLDAIIDSTVGDASPIKLSFVPISASIAVTRDGKVVKRSRAGGWDFRSSSNAVVFFNLPFDPAHPSDTIVSYRRWATQVPIE
jgi:hypothetical protein